MRLLIVDDHINFALALRASLSGLFAIDVCYSLAEARQKVAEIESGYSTVILDALLPDGTGDQFCVELRADKITWPILMLSGIKQVGYICQCLDHGADDYISKPFTEELLRARLRALLRRPQALQPTILTSQKINYWPKTLRATVAGHPISLCKKERLLLESLLINKGFVVTKTTLEQQIWDDLNRVTSNTIEVHVSRLRAKIRRFYKMEVIKCAPGIGYIIEK